MRERLEDLGRIMVLVDQALDDQHWTTIHTRNKDYAEWFLGQSREKQYDIITDFVYQQQGAKDRLYEILEIAKGEDILNEKRME